MKTTRKMRGNRLFLALSAAALLLLGACGDPPPLPICGQIPDGGCPIGRGGSCDDTYCAALYDCVDSKWTRVSSCEGGAGGSGGGPGGSGGAGQGGGSCTMVTLDHTGETLGCKPDLENPDCPAAAAETCAESACLTSCLDFFLCTKDGWIDVAHCDDQGQLTIVQ
ncbi:MAG: hypothetical protein ABI193_22400 [Minicystis sp.]